MEVGLACSAMLARIRRPDVSIQAVLRDTGWKVHLSV